MSGKPVKRARNKSIWSASARHGGYRVGVSKPIELEQSTSFAVPRAAAVQDLTLANPARIGSVLILVAARMTILRVEDDKAGTGWGQASPQLWWSTCPDHIRQVWFDVKHDDPENPGLAVLYEYSGVATLSDVISILASLTGPAPGGLAATYVPASLTPASVAGIFDGIFELLDRQGRVGRTK